MPLPPAAHTASRRSTATAVAWLLVLDGEGWWAEGRYD